MRNLLKFWRTTFLLLFHPRFGNFFLWDYWIFLLPFRGIFKNSSWNFREIAWSKFPDISSLLVSVSFFSCSSRAANSIYIRIPVFSNQILHSFANTQQISSKFELEFWIRIFLSFLVILSFSINILQVKILQVNCFFPRNFEEPFDFQFFFFCGRIIFVKSR